MNIQDMLAFTHLDGLTEAELVEKLEQVKSYWEDAVNDAMHLTTFATLNGLSTEEHEQRKAWAREAIHEETFMMQAITARLTALHMARA